MSIAIESPQRATTLAPLPLQLEPGVPAAFYGTTDIAPEQRLAHWRTQMATVCDVRPDPGVDPSQCVIEADKWLLNGAMVVSTRHPSHSLVRTAGHARGDGLDCYLVNVSQVAGLQVDADGRATDTAAEQMVLLDTARAQTVHYRAGHTIAFYASRDSLDALLPRPLDLHGVVLRGAASVLLSSHLFALPGYLPSMTAQEAEGARLSTLHLLAASLAPSFDSLGLARPAIDGALRRQIRQFIDAHLCDSELGVERIAGHFRISRSTIYRLFDQGVANFIKERRLTRIHALLAAPERKRQLGLIAEDHGFTNASQFSRAFRAQFGYSPREAMNGAAVAGAGTAAASGTQRGPAGSAFAHWVRKVETAA
jgi:AraC-like DNA-binding protein